MSDFNYWKREMLYAEVWAQPATKVGEKFGVSDVAIGKLCRRLRVPVPGRGYWARKEAGYTVKQTPLPPFKNPPVIPHRKHVQSPKPQIDASDSELSKIAEVESHVVLIPTVEHVLITKARRVLERGRAGEHERIIPPPKSSCLAVQVSRDCLERALRIMNAIVFALEAEGLDVTVSEQSTSVEVFGQQISISLVEYLTLKQKREVESYSGTRILYVYGRSGKLGFSVSPSAKWSRGFWGDGKFKKLEQLLPKCVGGVFRNARLLRVEREAFEQSRQEWQRKIDEEDERVRREIEEKQRLQNLEGLISNWHKAQQIRDFMDIYEKLCLEQGVAVSPESPKGEWIAWARKKADWLDPLMGTNMHDRVEAVERQL